jgi:hypothetical protein
MNTIFDIVNRWVQENYSTVRYSVQGQPVIQTLPENYHVNAQPTQPNDADLVATILALSAVLDAQSVPGTKRTLIVGTPEPYKFDFYPADAFISCNPAITELPRWYGDAAARESATGEHTDAGQRATHERAAGDTGRGPDHSAFYDYVRDAIAYERGDWRFSAEL